MVYVYILLKSVSTNSLDCSYTKILPPFEISD